MCTIYWLDTWKTQYVARKCKISWCSGGDLQLVGYKSINNIDIFNFNDNNTADLVKFEAKVTVHTNTICTKDVEIADSLKYLHNF